MACNIIHRLGEVRPKWHTVDRQVAPTI